MMEKSLHDLGDTEWGDPAFDAALAGALRRLRRKPIGDFSVEDLRVAVGQKVGIAHLVPLAIERLEASPLAGGDFYPGDLLMAVLRAESQWRRLPRGAEYARRLYAVVERALALLAKVPPGTTAAHSPLTPDEPDEGDREHLEPALKAALAYLH